jgi:uncharacterized protein YqeY
MSLRSEIQEKQYAAMKTGNAKLLNVMRFLMSAVKNEEIQKKAELNDEEVQNLISKQVKQLKDALKDFQAGGREDLVEKTQEEIEILSEYLPKQLSDDELASVIEKVIKDVDAKTPQDAGKVMGQVMKEVKGKADGNKVREIVLGKLSS